MKIRYAPPQKSYAYFAHADLIRRVDNSIGLRDGRKQGTLPRQ